VSKADGASHPVHDLARLHRSPFNHYRFTTDIETGKTLERKIPSLRLMLYGFPVQGQDQGGHVQLPIRGIGRHRTTLISISAAAARSILLKPAAQGDDTHLVIFQDPDGFPVKHIVDKDANSIKTFGQMGRPDPEAGFEMSDLVAIGAGCWIKIVRIIGFRTE
jgi:hypothetical protein